jgi:hypothetical protein
MIYKINHFVVLLYKLKCLNEERYNFLRYETKLNLFTEVWKELAVSGCKIVLPKLSLSCRHQNELNFHRPLCESVAPCRLNHYMPFPVKTQAIEPRHWIWRKSGFKPESTTVPNGRHKFPLLDETFLRKSGSQAGSVAALQSHGRVPPEPILCKRFFLKSFYFILKYWWFFLVIRSVSYYIIFWASSGQFTTSKLRYVLLINFINNVLSTFVF